MTIWVNTAVLMTEGAVAESGHRQTQQLYRKGAHRHPVLGVIHKHALHQLNAGWLQAWKGTCHLLRLPVGKLMPVPELANIRPDCLIRRPQELEDMQ